MNDDSYPGDDFTLGAIAAADADDGKLDACGHLSWTVGNEDWIACFDARRTSEGIEYHVVVDCESGGFVDTVEHATVPATEDGILTLLALPDYWAGICMEHYGVEDEAQYGPVEWEDATKRWDAYVRKLLAQPAPETEDEPEETCWDDRTVRSWRP